MNDVYKSDLELSIVKTVDYASYLLNLDTICKVIANARECIANCKVDSNPFNLHSMTIMCSPEIRKETKKFARCMKEEGKTVRSICERQCGNIKKINDEIEATTTELNSKNIVDEMKLAAIMKKTNEACGMTKCYARCSRNNFASACHHLGHEDAGEFLYAFVDAVNNAMVEDVQEQQLVETMVKSSPPQCNFMYAPGVLFNKTADDVMLRELLAQMGHNSDGGKSHPPRTPKNELEQLQRRILLKELEVLDKRAKLLEKENYKLDMEIALVAKQEAF